MPTYDYKCLECDHAFDAFQGITESPLAECPECHGKVKRLLGRGGMILFNGSGFYETDYKRRPPGGGSERLKRERSRESGE